LRYFLLFLFPLFLFSKQFKVASYNVENLFDAVYVGTEYDDYRQKHNWTKRMVEIKLNHTAEVICDLDADILGLQEIENSNIFEQLKKRLDRVGCGYRYSAITTKKNATIQIALLSNFPIVNKKELQVSYSPRVRNILEVEVDTGRNNLTIFVNHWKSKSRKGVESKRIKYAKVLQKRIISLASNKEYIVIGDLNSNYNAHQTLEEKLNDTGGRTGISNILQTVIDNKLIAENQILKMSKGALYNAWQELPFKQRWSHKFYGNRSTLDHILLPPSMFDKKGIDYVNDSFKVFKAPYLFTKRGYINAWKYKNGKHMAKGYSDHLPVYAMFGSQAYIADTSAKVPKIVNKDIDFLYTVDSIENQIKLEDVTVIFKRRTNAIVKQTKSGRGIYLYGCAKGLKEGHSYDILVQDITSYKGLKEITDIIKLRDKGRVELSKFYSSVDSARQNEVLKNIEGIYKNKHLHISDQTIAIHFKNKKDTPPDDSYIKIHYAHIGYYKKLQLVIYSKKDFEILER